MKFLKNYWKSILATLIILVLSFARFSEIKDIPKVDYLDKIIHFLMYSVLTFVVMLDNFHDVQNRNKRWLFLLLCLFFPFMLGIVTEVLQPLFLNGRYSDVYDSLSNAIGVLAGWGIFTLIKLKL